MAFSIRTKLVLCCVFLVLLTGGSLMWFAHRDTISTLRSGARKSLDNVMYVLERELAAAHADALELQLESVERLKEELRLTAHLAARLAELLPRDFSDPALSAAGAAGMASRPQTDPGWQEAEGGPDWEIFKQDGRGAWRCLGGEGAAERVAEELSPGLTAQVPLLSGARAELFTLEPGKPERLILLQRSGEYLILVRGGLGRIAEESEKRKSGNTRRFQELIREVQVQRTGFAAAVDQSGAIVAGSPGAALSPHFLKTLAVETFTGAQRRVMLLPMGERKNSPEALYLVSYFRPLGWHLVVAAPLDEMEATVFELVGRQLMLTAGIVLGGILLGLVLSGRIAGPLRRLTAVVRELPKQDILTLDSAELAGRLPGKRRDEIGELSSSFGFMAAELHANVLKLVEATAKSERLAGELAVAHDIQYGILPEPLDTGQRLELYASMVTAKEVGGDLYDYFFINEHELCFAIGDVSDKSVPAALFMSMVVTTMRSVPRTGALDPAEILAHVNNVLAAHNPRNMFVTLCIGVIDLRDGRLRWASGGHLPPVRVTAEGAAELELSGDMVAGVFEDVPYTRLEDRLKPGECIFLYTDGVSEAFNPEQEMYGRDRLLPDLHARYGCTAEELGRHIIGRVGDFAGEAEQSDDIAVMVLRFLG